MLCLSEKEVLYLFSYSVHLFNSIICNPFICLFVTLCTFGGRHREKRTRALGVSLVGTLSCLEGIQPKVWADKHLIRNYICKYVFDEIIPGRIDHGIKIGRWNEGPKPTMKEWWTRRRSTRRRWIYVLLQVWGWRLHWINLHHQNRVFSAGTYKIEARIGAMIYPTSLTFLVIHSIAESPRSTSWRRWLYS